MWETGKLYFRILAIQYSKNEYKKIVAEHKKIGKSNFKRKSKVRPRSKQNKKLGRIPGWHKLLQIPRHSINEKLIINEEKPTKYFYLQEKQQ